MQGYYSLLPTAGYKSSVRLLLLLVSPLFYRNAHMHSSFYDEVKGLVISLVLPDIIGHLMV
jgi:hypothetical protein